MPDLLASVTFGDTPNNGLQEVEDMTQSRGTYSLTPNNGLEEVEDLTPLPKTTFVPIKPAR